MNKAYYNLVNEGGEGYVSEKGPSAEFMTELAACKAKSEKTKAEWTKEVTTERRAAWNAYVTKTGCTVVAEIEQAVGFKMSTLQWAVSKYF